MEKREQEVERKRCGGVEEWNRRRSREQCEKEEDRRGGKEIRKKGSKKWKVKDVEE